MCPPPRPTIVDLPIFTTTTEPMMRDSQPTTTLESVRLPVQAKLAAAWTSFMFLYVYVDVLGFYKPGVVDDILDGIVFEFDITPSWAITALTLMAVPILMVVLSTTLPARANRIMNLVVASVYVPVSAFNVLGESSWIAYYGLGVALEVVVLAFILRLAWTWPRTTSSTTTVAGAAVARSPQVGVAGPTIA
jgi:Family of unknown function (DUF6326)